MATCPVCASTELEEIYPSYEGTCITSDMMVLEQAQIDNRLCSRCGLIFNARGTRGFTESFYRNSYSLMMRSKDQQIQSFGAAKPMTQAERTFNILCEMVDLGPTGVVLEAGAGKGDFLDCFVAAFPGWKVNAFEPSASAQLLSEKFPTHRIEKCDYHAFEGLSAECDLVVALGVLEHVENPRDMLEWAHGQLKTGGYCYVRVPNFENNPNDLFCADHLSKLTPGTLRALARAAGFEVVDDKTVGVPIFIALRKTGQAHQGTAPQVVADNRTIARNNADIAERAMNSILEAHDMARQRNEPFAIFGLGSAGLFAPYFADFPTDEIEAYIDENQSVWGSSIHDRPVGGLDFIEEQNIRHIALAISPVYFDKVTEKLRKFNVNVYS